LKYITHLISKVLLIGKTRQKKTTTISDGPIPMTIKPLPLKQQAMLEYPLSRQIVWNLGQSLQP
jgi:hypothetical protein